MSITFGSNVLDFGLTYLANQANSVALCSAQPTTYAQVAILTLGTANPGVGGVFSSPTNAPTNGRQCALIPITNGTVSQGGTASWIAVVDNINSVLLLTANLDLPATVLIGYTWQLASFNAIISSGASIVFMAPGLADSAPTFTAPALAALSPPVVTNASINAQEPLTANQLIGAMSATYSPTAWSINIVTPSSGTTYFAIANNGNITVTAAGAAALTTAQTFTLTVQASNAVGTGFGTATINCLAASATSPFSLANSRAITASNAPNALNTGPTALGLVSANLPTYTGPTTITVDNTVISNQKITTTIAIAANNVKFSGCYWPNGGGVDAGGGAGTFTATIVGNQMTINSVLSGSTASIRAGMYLSIGYPSKGLGGHAGYRQDMTIVSGSGSVWTLSGTNSDPWPNPFPWTSYSPAFANSELTGNPPANFPCSILYGITEIAYCEFNNTGPGTGDANFGGYHHIHHCHAYAYTKFINTNWSWWSIHDCYLHNIRSTGEHSENIMTDGTGGGYWAYNNTIVNATTETSCWFGSNDFGWGDMKFADNNFLIGGGDFTTNLGTFPAVPITFAEQSITNSRITNNVYASARDVSGGFGIFYAAGIVENTLFSNNSDFYSGQLFDPNNYHGTAYSYLATGNPNIIIAQFSPTNSFTPEHADFLKNIATGNTITLKGCATAGATVQVFDGSTLLGTAAANPQSAGTAHNTGGGCWSFTTVALASGSHSFTAKDLTANVTSLAMVITI